MLCFPLPCTRGPTTTVSAMRQAPRAPRAPLSNSARAPCTGGRHHMGTTDNKQLLQHLFAEMATGNFEPFLGHMADDVRWTVMGTTKLSGTLTGKQEVITRRLTPILDGWDSEGQSARGAFRSEKEIDAAAGHRTPAEASGRRAHQNADARLRALKGQRLSLSRRNRFLVRAKRVILIPPFGGVGQKSRNWMFSLRA